MAILNPYPFSPIKLDLGTLTSSNITIVVGEAFHPIFSSFTPKDKP